ncbi:MAG: 1-acyl-sn-glycerol-3-phosphate acyltransferase [Clostridia bacterium]|nr:1-acyl-sn-glycerol-3-phosphate acyltransferase [Clostridia bacterium]
MAKKGPYYYTDELNDDFAKKSIQKIKRKPVTESFRYLPRHFWGRAGRWLVKKVLMPPIAFIVLKIFCRVKVVGRDITKPYRNGPAFIYGNHTGYFTDTFDPAAVAYPREPFTVVNSDSVSIFGIRHLMLAGGAIPVPDDYHAMPNFYGAIEDAVKKNGWVAVYPEAHIWEWYTKIRPFTSVSFRYPVRYGTPVFSYTMTYKKKKHGKRPKKILYVDGPFFPDKKLPEKEAAEKLRREVYDAMCGAAKRSDCEYVEYIYAPDGASR